LYLDSPRTLLNVDETTFFVFKHISLSDYVDEVVIRPTSKMQKFNTLAHRCTSSVQFLSHRRCLQACQAVGRIRIHVPSAPNFAEIAQHIKLGTTEKIATNLHRLSQSEHNYTLMFDYYERKRDSTGMKQFMHLMQNKFHISPEIDHLCTLMRILGVNNLIQEAESLFSSIPNKNQKVYNTIITIHAKRGLMEAVDFYIIEMTSDGFVLEKESIEFIVQAYCKLQDFDRLKQYLQKARNLNYMSPELRSLMILQHVIENDKDAIERAIQHSGKDLKKVLELLSINLFELDMTREAHSFLRQLVGQRKEFRVPFNVYVAMIEAYYRYGAIRKARNLVNDMQGHYTVPEHIATFRLYMRYLIRQDYNRAELLIDRGQFSEGMRTVLLSEMVNYHLERKELEQTVRLVEHMSQVDCLLSESGYRQVLDLCIEKEKAQEAYRVCQMMEKTLNLQ
jgi:tetratricopeptide (TPR) repeat protein